MNNMNNMNGMNNMNNINGMNNMSNMNNMNNINAMTTMPGMIPNSMMMNTSMVTPSINTNIPISSSVPNGMQSAIVTSSIATSLPLLMNNLPNMLSNTVTTSSALTNSTTVTTNVEKEPTKDDKEKEEEKPKSKYKKFSDFPLISLTNDAIHKSHPEYIESIYEFLSYQCKQCGRRYYKSEESDKDSEEKIYSHLDWHFRQNRRLKNQFKQTLCRGWQDISEDDWIDSKTVEAKFTSPTFFQFDATNTETENTENEEEDKEKIKYLPCDGTQQKCYVCNEEFEKHWHEDEEEWMLKNAISKEDKVFHPSCYTDYISQKKLLNKIKEKKVKEEEANSSDINNSDDESKSSIASNEKRKLEMEEDPQENDNNNKKIKLE